MARDNGIEGIVEILRALGDVTRLRLLNLLGHSSELCVFDLVAITGESQPKVSRHLAYLRRVGLVTYRKDGLWVYYRLVDRPPPAVEVLIDALRRSLDLLVDLDDDLHELTRLRDKAAPVRFTQRVNVTTAVEIVVPTIHEAQDEGGVEPELEVELL